MMVTVFLPCLFIKKTLNKINPIKIKLMKNYRSTFSCWIWRRFQCWTSVVFLTNSFFLYRIFPKIKKHQNYNSTQNIFKYNKICNLRLFQTFITTKDSVTFRAIWKRCLIRTWTRDFDNFPCTIYKFIF